MRIRWGIVSAGKISSDFVNAINTFPGKGDQVVAAVAARDRRRAEEFAKLHNVPTVFDSYQTMAKCDDIGKLLYLITYVLSFFLYLILFHSLVAITYGAVKISMPYSVGYLSSMLRQ